MKSKNGFVFVIAVLVIGFLCALFVYFKGMNSQSSVAKIIDAVVVEDVVPAFIQMDTAAYDLHRLPKVVFPHKKHFMDYGITCGSCHHDADAEPVTSESEILKCIECHTLTAEKPRRVRLSYEERMEYHMNAVHQMCRSCHKQHKRDGNTNVPMSCAQCHDGTSFKYKDMVK